VKQSEEPAPWAAAARAAKGAAANPWSASRRVSSGTLQS
jgi:hypothetical protein